MFLESRFSQATTEAMSLVVLSKASNLKVQLAEGKATPIEEKAAVVELVAQMARAQAAWAIKVYKNSTDFEDEVREFACDAYWTGIEVCRGKVSKIFHLLDQSEISVDNLAPPKEKPELKMIGARATQKSKVKEVIGQAEIADTPKGYGTPIKEMVAKTFTKMEAIIIAIVEALKYGSHPMGSLKQ